MKKNLTFESASKRLDEILQQLPDVDNIVVPIGGGGLIAGVAFTAKMLKPSVRIYGVQASGAASMFCSFNTAVMSAGTKLFFFMSSGRSQIRMA